MNYNGKYMVNRYEQIELFSRAEYKGVWTVSGAS